MLANVSVTAMEGAITSEGLVLYLALLCAMAAAVLALGIALRHRVLR